MARNIKPKVSDLYAQPIDRKRPVWPQMAAAIIRITQARGDCLRRDLERAGFTAGEIDAFGSLARTTAAEERPDLAHKADKEHAAAYRARQVA